MVEFKPGWLEPVMERASQQLRDLPESARPKRTRPAASPRILPGDAGARPTPDAGAMLAALSVWVDEGNAHRDPEAQTWGRVAKVGEECGEAIAALVGATGQNPRKGIVGSMDDVVKELLDVAVTALAAVEHLTGNGGESSERLSAHLTYLLDRAGIAASPPVGSGDTTPGGMRAMTDAEEAAEAAAGPWDPPVPRPDGDDTLRFATADALREHLDGLNEAGTDPTVAGVDAHGRYFLITLQGPYAETEAVLFGVPWDREIDWPTPRLCDECGTHEAFGIDDLTYPAAVNHYRATQRPEEGDRG